jgi:hypothetical protein
MKRPIFAFLLALSLSAHATVVGFDQPAIGHVVTGTTFDDGWTATLDNDHNSAGSGANVYWYGSPPSGLNEQFEPDPALIRLGIRTGGNPDPTYHGGAVWLDGTATINGGFFTRGNGVAIDQTFADKAGSSYFLSFSLNTEVMPLNLPTYNLKGSPAGLLLSIHGVEINSAVADGAFLSTGLPPVFTNPSLPSDTDWTKYTIKFVGSGHDNIQFQDDITAMGALDGLTNGTFSSNTVVANVTLVPETREMLGLGLGAALIGFALFGRRRRVTSLWPVS